MNPIERIAALGQRIWYDNISRDLLADGSLKALIRTGVRGVTTNPAIFEKAIREGTHYDDDIRHLPARESDPEAWIRDLMVKDVQLAADALRSVYDRSLGEDGYVSIDVDPRKGGDAEAMIAEAMVLWQRVARPNIMIKIPATPAGVVALRATVRAGLNVNATLLFAPARYEEVANAYRGALEDRLADGQPIDRVVSVASVFVSRVDTVVDGLLRDRIKTAPLAEGKRLTSLLGRTGMANAHRIYRRYRDIFRSRDFARLRARGAHPQWLLWASISSKDPAYPPTWYIDRLIASDTITTVPPATLAALLTHNRVRALLETELPQAPSILDAVRREGIDLPDILDRLASEGLAAFGASYEMLAVRLVEKRAALAQSS